MARQDERATTSAQARDAQFVRLLRLTCVRAAGIGAMTAATEAVPGLRRVLGLFLGEMLDAGLLAAAQRDLVETTFDLYGLRLPQRLHGSIVDKVLLLGTGASLTGDALLRGVVQRGLGPTGGLFARGIMPFAAIVTSATSNATVTYAIGKRAQAAAKLRRAPITGLPDAIRAFSGVDERRIYAWSLAGAQGSLRALSRALRRVTTRSDRPAARRAGR